MSFPPLPFRVRTKVSWAGEEEGDLGFMENEIIDVYSIVDESWLSGRLRRNKNEGIFPKDYIQVLQDTSVPTSQSNTPKNTPKQSKQTPINDYEYEKRMRSSKQMTPTPGYHSAKSSPRKPVDDEDFSFDSSMEIDKYRTSEYSKKSRQKLKSKYVHDERQREIERFKRLQQQQQYHVKSNDGAQQAHRQSMHGEHSKTSPYRSPNHSFGGSPYNRQASSPNLNYDSTPINGSPTYRKSARGGVHAHTVESFSPEPSPGRSKMISGSPEPNASHASYVDELAIKKKQLELEILQLEELKRSSIQNKRGSRSPTSPNRYKYDSGSSFISEDLLSSKRNYQSKDDLSKKFSRYNTDDEITGYDLTDNSRSRSGSPPPPPPPKHHSPMRDIRDSYKAEEPSQFNIPYDADDFRFSGNSRTRYNVTEEEMLMLSQLPPQELKSSLKSLQSDVLNLSELSATSAGSFLRHKTEREYQLEESRMRGLNLNDHPLSTEFNGSNESQSKSIMDTVFQDKSPKQMSIFKKFLKKKDETINPLEQKLVQEEQVDWATFKKELNRVNTLTSQDKQARTKRVVREEGNIIVKPFDYISEINTNEMLSDDVEPLALPEGCFKNVDVFASRYSTDTDLNEIITDISVKFKSSKVNQVRAVMMHFLGFNVIEETGKISTSKPKLNELRAKGEASIYQLNYLFKKVLDALRIPSEVVLGFWKKPNEFYHNEQYIINHCWLSVLVESQFRIVDLLSFKNGSVCNVRNNVNGFNEFYFLTEPLSLITTHIPSIIDLQHITPPIDQNIAFYLPRLYSGYYNCQLMMKNFNNALTRLTDLEFFEAEIEVPMDVELFTLIKTSKVTSNEYSLCQIYWNNNKRYARVKAILPEKETIGVLQVFAGQKGLQKHFDNVHELAIVIPIYHEGDSKPCKFVPRYPTVQSQNNDLYVKHPQTNKIIIRNSYNFEIIQHPSRGITPGSKILNQDFKMVIESPSGKYFKLAKEEANTHAGSYISTIKCQELGVYRGLVIGDGGNSWYVFAQWECVAGTVTN